jgi:DNA-binding winged helix-turn-helix (wHTH) protein
MQRRNLRTHPRQIARRRNSRQSATKETNTHPALALWDENPLAPGANRSSSTTSDAAVEFGRFRVLLRHRQLLADGVPIELGTRAFDLLIALLEADGLLISKEELLSRVWPGIVVSEENLKVQVSALRKALGADRDVIRTEFGRGYRFTAVLRWNAGPDAWQSPSRAKLRCARALLPQNDWRSLRCSFGSN